MAQYGSPDSSVPFFLFWSKIGVMLRTPNPIWFSSVKRPHNSWYSISRISELLELIWNFEGCIFPSPKREVDAIPYFTHHPRGPALPKDQTSHIRKATT